MVPAVAFGRPENVACLVQDAEMRLPGIHVFFAFFTQDNSLLSGARVHFAQFDGLLSALRRVVRERLALRVPVESRSALELHLDRRGFDFDAFAALDFENDGLCLWKDFPRQRIYNCVFPGAELVRRNKLQIAEAPGAAGVHAVGYELG